MFKPEMSQLKDKMGRCLTNGLILELSYMNPKNAIYTLKDDDYEYKGKTYYSLKKIYMEIADPKEYFFATHCFANYKTWVDFSQKSDLLYSGNKLWVEKIEEWREELEVMLAAQGIRGIIEDAAPDNPKGYQARKFLTDRGFTDKKVGRPTKDNKERDEKIQCEIDKTVSETLERLRH